MRRWVEIVLCRHTQTDLNAQGRCSGAREDVPLNDTGRAQARELADKVAAFHPKAVFCSDLLRARQTAMFVGSACRAKIKADSRLREVDIGSIGTMDKKTAKQQFAHLWSFEDGVRDYDLREVGGESHDQVMARLKTFLRDLLNEYGVPVGDQKKTVVVVGHGTALETMLWLLDVGPPVLHKQGEFQVVVYSA